MDGRRHHRTAPAKTANVTALSAKTVAGPERATISPATAGPTARATFMLIAPSAEADGSSDRGTSSGMTAW